MVTFLSPCLCYFLEFVSQFYRVLMKPTRLRVVTAVSGGDCSEVGAGGRAKPGRRELLADRAAG